MTPLEMAHKIMEYAALEHAKDLRFSLYTPSQRPALNARQLAIHEHLGDLAQVMGAYHDLAGIIEQARLPIDPAIGVHPTRYVALAKNLDGYLQGLGFKSMEKPIYDAFTKARETAKTPGFNS